MMFRALLVASLALCASARLALAEPVIKVINFTAAWCPNCRILDPRLADAVADFDGDAIEQVNLDMTRTGQAYSDETRARAMAVAARLARQHKVDELWAWYGGTTGLAAVVAADTGEPIYCFTRRDETRRIKDRLRLARLLAEHAQPGARRPEGYNCPPARN